MDTNINNQDLLNTLVLTLVKESGSDIHLMANSSPALRISGELILVTSLSVMAILPD